MEGNLQRDPKNSAMKGKLDTVGNDVIRPHFSLFIQISCSKRNPTVVFYSLRIDSESIDCHSMPGLQQEGAENVKSLRGNDAVLY